MSRVSVQRKTDAAVQNALIMITHSAHAVPQEQWAQLDTARAVLALACAVRELARGRDAMCPQGFDPRILDELNRKEG